MSKKKAKPEAAVPPQDFMKQCAALVPGDVLNAGPLFPGLTEVQIEVTVAPDPMKGFEFKYAGVRLAVRNISVTPEGVMTWI